MTTHLLIAVLAAVPACAIISLYLVRRMLNTRTELVTALLARRATDLRTELGGAETRLQEHTEHHLNRLADTVAGLADVTRAVLAGQQTRKTPEPKPAAAPKNPPAAKRATPTAGASKPARARKVS